MQAWGSPFHGGSAPSGLSDVTAIYSTSVAFAALKTDGTVQTWGDPRYGGSAPASLNKVATVFGRSIFFSDSTSRNLYPCPNRYFGAGMPYCTACPNITKDGQKNDLAPGIRSTIASCLSCDQPNFSEDGETCAVSCADGYTYYPPTFYDSTMSGCQPCTGQGLFFNSTSNRALFVQKGLFLFMEITKGVRNVR